MKKLLYPLAFALTVFLILYSCSTEEDDAPPPDAIVKKYILAVTAGEGGTVSSSGGTYSQGTQVSITATPSSGYTFTGWSNGTTDNPISITLNSDQNLTANFTKRSYPLSINIIGEGTVTEEVINTGKTTDYEHGTTVRLTAVPNDGWGVTKWKGAIESKSATIDIVVNEDKEVTIEFHERYIHKDRSPNYSYPNSTTSIAWEDKYVPNKFPKDSVFLSYYIGYEFSEHSEKYGEAYDIFSQGIFYDFNQDANIDYLAWMKYASNRNIDGDDDGTDFTKPGKFILISDVMNPSREHFLYDTNDKYFEFITDLNDIDGDGVLEIISAYSNGHRQQNGEFGYTTNADIIKVSQQNNIQQTEYLDIKRDAHDISSGDVDNDGDVDILFWEFVFGNNPRVTDQNSMQPILFKNDGSGNFLKTNKYETFIGLDKLEKEVGYLRDNGNYWYEALTVELFDINKDGNLDILAATDYSFLADNFRPKNRVYWGNGDGTFDFTNPVELVNNTFKDYNTELVDYYSILGAAFTDYDNDNDYDIVLTGSIDYKACALFIQLFENQGNKFKDVTKEKIDVFKDLGGTNCNELIYQNKGTVNYSNDPHIIDIDEDGDFDILPHIKGWDTGFWYDENGGKTQRGYTDNFFYENVGGRFELRWYNDPEE